MYDILGFKNVHVDNLFIIILFGQKNYKTIYLILINTTINITNDSSSLSQNYFKNRIKKLDL